MAKTNKEPKDIIEEVDLGETASNLYVNFATHAIINRNLPNALDGLKPVQRRILYCMDEGNYKIRTRKSAKAVGDIMGNYHPHGDSSIYEALVRMGQEWKVALPLIHIEGNKGNIDGDKAAAMRYTETKLEPVVDELMYGIKKRGVTEYQRNYDDTTDEPKILPTKLPLLLLNGATGVSPIYKISLVPHNFVETLQACIAVLEDESITIDRLMEIIPAPDFPTGGVIINAKTVRNLFLTGKGALKTRATYKVIEEKNGKQIIFTSIPYEVNKSVLNTQLIDIVLSKELEGLKDIKDASNRDGVNIVVELDKNADVENIIGYLFKKTNLMCNIFVDNNVIYKNKPVLMPLKKMLMVFNEFRIETIRKIYEEDKKIAEKKIHNAEGFIKLFDDLDKYVKLIRTSTDEKEAKQKFMEEGFSAKQAENILEIKLVRLTKLDVEKYKELKKKSEIERDVLNKALSSEVLIKKALLRSYKELIKKYGKERRTEIIQEDENWDVKKVDLIKEEDVQISVTKTGYIKRSSLRSYTSTIANNKEETSFETLPDDEIIFVGKGSTKGGLLLFTNKYRYSYIPIHKITETVWKDMGKNISVLGADFDSDEHIIKAFTVDEKNNKEDLLFINNNGMIRRTFVSNFIRTQRVFDLVDLGAYEDGVKLLDVWKIAENEKGYLGFKNSSDKVMYIETETIPIKKATKAKGMKGISLNKGEEVVEASYNNYEFPIYEKYCYLKNRASKGTKFKSLAKRDDVEIAEKELPYLKALQKEAEALKKDEEREEENRED